MTDTKIHLVRHGETAWSLTGQHTGRTDLDLTADGEDQARGLAPMLLQIGFAQVLASPRLRALRTRDLAGLGGLAGCDPDLAEWDYGQYEGQRTADIWLDRPGRRRIALWNQTRTSSAIA